METKPEERNQSSRSEVSAPSPGLLEIRRQFQVPVTRLFEAFASAEALKAWWWPNGLRADRIDFVSAKAAGILSA